MATKTRIKFFIQIYAFRRRSDSESKKGMIEKMKNIILSYNMPDMDGVACMYAYSELLNKQEQETGYFIKGKPKKEVKIVCEMFDIKLESEKSINAEDKIILVDTNQPFELKQEIKLNNVIEIIDHHKKSEELYKMPNAKIQIEEVGAAATLVAERYKLFNYEISRNAAILLYYGIISNTVNLESKITTDRDRKIVEWIKNSCTDISEEKIKEVFEKKSIFENPLREEMEIEYKDPFLKISWSMGQLEVVNVEEFLEKEEKEIRKILDKVQSDTNIKYLSINCVDILNGYSIIIAQNKKTEELISDLLNVNFFNGKARVNQFLIRKEIIKIVREKYGK